MQIKARHSHLNGEEYLLVMALFFMVEHTRQNKDVTL